jgi:hypothetical protein
VHLPGADRQVHAGESERPGECPDQAAAPEQWLVRHLSPRYRRL